MERQQPGAAKNRPRPDCVGCRNKANMTISPVLAKNPAVAHVLVVDDEPLIRWSLAETLSGRGHTVAEAGNGKEALAAVKGVANRPDVVLLDYRLPDSNDMSLLAAIKRELPESPIILMT